LESFPLRGCDNDAHSWLHACGFAPRVTQVDAQRFWLCTGIREEIASV